MPNFTDKNYNDYNALILERDQLQKEYKQFLRDLSPYFPKNQVDKFKRDAVNSAELYEVAFRDNNFSNCRQHLDKFKMAFRAIQSEYQTWIDQRRASVRREIQDDSVSERSPLSVTSPSGLSPSPVLDPSLFGHFDDRQQREPSIRRNAESYQDLLSPTDRHDPSSNTGYQFVFFPAPTATKAQSLQKPPLAPRRPGLDEL